MVQVPQGMPIAVAPAPEDTPTVVASNGVTIWAYAAFTDRAPYAAPRIALQVHSLGEEPADVFYPGPGLSPGRGEASAEAAALLAGPAAATRPTTQTGLGTVADGRGTGRFLPRLLGKPAAVGQDMAR